LQHTPTTTTAPIRIEATVKHPATSPDFAEARFTDTARAEDSGLRTQLVEARQPSSISQFR
jgi:hypothetical protein